MAVTVQNNHLLEGDEIIGGRHRENVGPLRAGMDESVIVRRHQQQDMQLGLQWQREDPRRYR